MIRFTKNKVRWVLAVVATIIVLVVLAVHFNIFTDKPTTSCIGSRPGTFEMFSGDDPLRQSFVPEKKHLSFVEVRIDSVYSPEASGELVFELTDSYGAVLSESSVPASELENDSYIRFDTDLVLDIDEEYTYSIHVENTERERPISVWISAHSKGEQTDLSVPGYAFLEAKQVNAQFGYEKMNYAALVGALALVVVCFLVAVTEVKMSSKAHRIWAYGTLALMPMIIFVIVEMLNDFSFFVKDSQVYVVNYLFYLLIFLLVFTVVNRLRASVILVSALIFVLAVINYYKILFRGEPLQVWDIVTVRTALNVSSEYPLLLSSVLVVTFLSLVLAGLLIAKVKYSIQSQRLRVLTALLTCSLLVLAVVSLFATDRYQITPLSFMQKIGITNNVWNQPSNYSKNGLLLALTMNAQDMIIHVPDGYSVNAVHSIQEKIQLGEYAHVAEADIDVDGSLEQPVIHDEKATEEVKPNIIVIMNESYTDLSAIAEFETNINITPYIDSLMDNTIKGNLYVSTYGGGTANSEFEFLTGNAMAFLPNGSVPYIQYIDEETGSLARTLKANGYSAIAVHPYLESGWNRTEVYDLMGFDQFLSIDDFNNPEYIRSYVSDASSFAALIELYENKEEGQPIFLFNVTMQNHGGYGKTYENFEEDVELPEYPGRFPETEQYLSLVRQTDIAVEDLIQYFSEQDEPTVICFFGDHLPSMKNGFYDTILGKSLSDLTGEQMQVLYHTEFFIWANYEIEASRGEQISINFLSTLLLETAGIELTDYHLFLDELHAKYPVITTMGVFDSSMVRSDCVSALSGDEMLRDYSYLMYNNLFGEEHRVPEIFECPCLSENQDLDIEQTEMIS